MGLPLYQLTQRIKFDLAGEIPSLPLLSNGFVLQAAALDLLWIYVWQHQLVEGGTIHSDAWMDEVFGGDIMAGFHLGETIDGRLLTIPMDQAMDYNRIITGTNTYDTIQAYSSDFCPLKFDRKFLKSIVMANLYSFGRICEDPYIEDVAHTYHSLEDGQVVTQKLPAIAVILKSKSIRAALLKEYQIIQSVRHQLESVDISIR